MKNDKIILSKLTFLSSVIILSFFFFNQTFSATSKEMQQDPYLAFAEVMPQPVGGLEAIYKNIKYPDIAKKAGVEGKVYVLVYINENGGVDDVKVVKGIGAGCDEAATSAIKKLKFTPAKNKGVNCKVKLSIPVTFKLR